jgi:hypothetical protein
MLIHGSPISATLASDPQFADRFWYWHGASGEKYIHSVYAPDQCPPLPGAVYVAVRRQGGMRTALWVGRFQPFWDGTLASAEAQRLGDRGVDEIHVHLLAGNSVAAEDILADLRDAMLSEEDEVQDVGFLDDDMAEDHMAFDDDEVSVDSFGFTPIGEAWRAAGLSTPAL